MRPQECGSICVAAGTSIKNARAPSANRAGNRACAEVINTLQKHTEKTGVHVMRKRSEAGQYQCQVAIQVRTEDPPVATRDVT